MFYYTYQKVTKISVSAFLV